MTATKRKSKAKGTKMTATKRKSKALNKAVNVALNAIDEALKEYKIGKIRSISLGYGGYQDAMFGLSVELGSKDWGVGDFKGFWSMELDSKGCKWTEKDREKAFADTMKFVNELLKKAKKNHLGELKGIPVEVTFEHQRLKSWRILQEVL